MDVPTGHLGPELLRQPGIEYFEADNEEFISKEPDLRKQGKEIFGISIKALAAKCGGIGKEPLRPLALARDNPRCKKGQLA